MDGYTDMFIKNLNELKTELIWRLLFFYPNEIHSPYNGLQFVP